MKISSPVKVRKLSKRSYSEDGNLNVAKYKAMLNAMTKMNRASGDFINGSILTEFCEHYRSLDWSKKKETIAAISTELSTPPDIAQVLANYKGNNSASLRELRENLIPPYDRLVSSIINYHPGGMKFVLDLRSDILQSMSEKKEKDVDLQTMNENMKSLLQNCMSLGFLKLIKLSWETTNGLFLEKILLHSKTLHAIENWENLKRRIGSGHRCYAFTHNTLPNEPLIFIEVGLTNRISDTISEMTVAPCQVAESAANVAIFYAIISTQPGLSGVDLGHLLISQVVENLKTEFPNLNTFSTLSPIPGFRSWLETQLQVAIKTESDLANAFGLEKFKTDTPIFTPADLAGFAKSTHLEALHSLSALLATLRSPADWEGKTAAQMDRLRQPLTRLVYRYLVHTKKRGLALNPVANFHLRNGARVHRINWKADMSDKGLRDSYGFMVNYLYDLPSLSDNSESYMLSGKINCSLSVIE